MSPPVRRGRSGARGGPRAGRVAGGAPPSPAREVAARVLERVEADLSFADSVLEAELTARRLEARDAALATEMVYGTLRWQRYLDWILAPHSRRRLESLDPRVRVLLRMTAYQIAFLERVPAFAAVNDAVTLAPLTPGVRAFVNAVLRSFSRRGAREREPAPPRNPSDALAVRCSFPTWIVERWTKRYGREDAESLMRALNERPPLTLRANRLRITRDALGQRLAEEDGLEWRPTRLAPEGVVVGHGGAPGEWRTFAGGSFAVQDEASMLIARLLAPDPGPPSPTSARRPAPRRPIWPSSWTTAAASSRSIESRGAWRESRKPPRGSASRSSTRTRGRSRPWRRAFVPHATVFWSTRRARTWACCDATPR